VTLTDALGLDELGFFVGEEDMAFLAGAALIALGFFTSPVFFTLDEDAVLICVVDGRATVLFLTFVLCTLLT